MRIGRLATTVVAGACLMGGATIALTHAGASARATLVSSSGSGFDSARDIAERGAGPSPSATGAAPLVIAPAAAQPADDADKDVAEVNDPAEVNEVNEANEPAEAAEPADANDPEHQGDGHHDDGSAQTQGAQTTDNSRGDSSRRGGDSGGHGGDNSNGN
jgi:hypothetical protein